MRIIPVERVCFFTFLLTTLFLLIRCEAPLTQLRLRCVRKAQVDERSSFIGASPEKGLNREWGSIECEGETQGSGSVGI